MKLTKCLFAAVLLCMMLAVAACGSDTPTVEENISYTITVVDNGGNPVSGVMVSICQNTEGGICYMPVKTDKNGIASFLKDVVPVQDNLKVRVHSGGGNDLPMADGEIGYTIIPNGTTEMTLTVLIMPE